MRLLIIILLFTATIAYCEITKTNDPVYEITSLENNSDNALKVRENFKDLYSNKQSAGDTITLNSKTTTELNLIVPTKVSQMYWNSTTLELWISTGTLRYQWKKK